MDFAAALDWLNRHINYEAMARAGRIEGLSLDAMRELVATLGDPQSAYPVIHITGTNGKGSTARVITRLLMAHGLSVGTYTSPHLERYTERIRWNDEEVSEEAFGAAIEAVATVEELLAAAPTHFEALTAGALHLFADVAVDVAVVEVGLLGRYDATNVVDADVAVVTNVGRDHTDLQGDWRWKVAEEKAGIVKGASHLVLGETDPRLGAAFLAEGPAATWRRGADFDCDQNRLAVGGRLVTLRTPHHSLDDLFLPLHGAHQGDNAAVALAAVEAFFGRPVAEEVADEALRAVRVPGRFEVLRRQPLVILDGAHNPDGAEAAGAVLAEEFTVDGRRTLVMGVLTGRDAEAMLAGVEAPTFDRVICCTPTSPRAMPADELATLARRLAAPAEPAASVEEGLARALYDAGEADLVFVTGSLYLVGAARAILTRS
ncbi:MAG: bifunctional folylpolyglutamate synthase/dihydrofolate synthase [Acidimicrobiia bacterium]|nr:bifunctional folylpolyglutamate synthase/dihydrofolate synthase [Acidimicrobiia bacterium]